MKRSRTTHIAFVLLLSAVLGTVEAAPVESNAGQSKNNVNPNWIRLISANENKDHKSYRWDLIRSSRLKVVQGWYTFDEIGIREHGGGGRRIAELKPMQLLLVISKEDDFLVLNRRYGFSSDFADQRADVTNRTKWPDSAQLKTYYYLSEPAGLTDKLQPLWKGEFVRNEKVVKSVVYAVRVVGQDVPNVLFDVNDTSEALRVGKKWRPAHDAFWSPLRLQLPASASDTHYESASSPAGMVFWMRFDLPRRDIEAWLARTPILPAYARFTADATVKEYLQTAYQSGAPVWWRPQELSEGIYALRRTNTKELADVSVGVGRLPGEKVRVYIGAFSPW